MYRFYAYYRNSFNAPQRVEFTARNLFEATEQARATYGNKFMEGHVGQMHG
jgi:hypothetical protein